MTSGRATLIWNAQAQAVTLVLPVAAPGCPAWWQTDEEVVLYEHGENLVIRRASSLKVCELCGDDHDNKFTVCNACENL